uniref:Uncharacterized protein n=1 Tax=Peronospora matthiolae TaxID=2874970 RepID=A0AAV1TAR3_9STRA
MARPHSLKRKQTVSAWRPTGRRRWNVPQGATRPTIPSAVHAHNYATTPSSDNRMIVLSEHIDIATRPLRTLLDSCATNIFVPTESLKIFPSRMRVRESPETVIIKYAGCKPRTHRRRSVVVPNQFDGFRSCDEFQFIDFNRLFDCIFKCRGLPGIVRTSIGFTALLSLVI